MRKVVGNNWLILQPSTYFSMQSVLSYCIGMDVDKATFKACLMARLTSGQVLVKASKTFTNKEIGFNELLTWTAKHVKETPVAPSYVMEATGVYHEHLAFFLHQKNQLVSVVLANKAKNYMKSLGMRSKNDKADAQGLATMGLQQSLDCWQPLSDNFYALRSLTRQIESLQNVKTVFTNQLEAATHSPFVDAFVIETLESLLEKLKKDIAASQKKVEAFIEQDAVLKAKYQLFDSLKGFGVMTFAVLVAETGGFELFKSQSQLVGYTGYDIVENQSGKRVGKTKISKKGNAHIRRILHMASLNMVTYNIPVFHHLYERVYERTKIKMKGYVAIQRKLLCLVYTLWKSDQAFDKDYLTKQAQESTANWTEQEERIGRPLQKTAS